MKRNEKNNRLAISHSPVDTLVFLLPDIIVSAWDCIDEALEIRVAEVCDGVASWMHVGFGGRLHDAVLRALDGIVGPPGHISITPKRIRELLTELANLPR